MSVGSAGLLPRLDLAEDDLPVVVWRSDRVLRIPTDIELAQLVAASAVSVADGRPARGRPVPPEDP